MKNKIMTIVVLTSMWACTNKFESKKAEHTQMETDMVENVVSLLGKEFESEHELHWKCTKGNEKGKEANEKYFVKRLNNQCFFVSWVEADGLGVSQVINLKDNEINCFLKIDQEIIPLSGTVSEL